MYASLGDIVFQTLVSFDALSDRRETRYSQLPLINGKPNLQRTGESLIEFSMGISFHVAFCNPENEYLKLNTARINGNILSFIYGNGFNEGDYVITNIERTINQTDKVGNFVEITCTVSLLEYAGGNPAAKQLEQDKKNAFAISSNRPLPAKTELQADNPALLTCTENKDVQQSAGKMDDATNAVNSKVNLVSTGIIDKGQNFVNQIGNYTGKMNTEIGKTNNSVGNVNNLIVRYGSITNQSPTLPASLLSVQSSLNAVSAQLILLGTLPSIINNVTDATSALTQLTNTLNVIATLKNNTQLMNNASAPIAKALALKRVMT